MSYVFSSIEADRLGGLALHAATQLDKMRREETIDPHPLREFAKAIAEFGGIDSGTGDSVRFLEPANSEVLSNAISTAFHRPVSNMDTLNREIASIVSRLTANISGNDALQALISFCLEIHNLILKSRSTVGMHERGVFDYERQFS